MAARREKKLTMIVDWCYWYSTVWLTTEIGNQNNYHEGRAHWSIRHT